MLMKYVFGNFRHNSIKEHLVPFGMNNRGEIDWEEFEKILTGSIVPYFPYVDNSP